jgi:hypothetical protein
MGILLSAGTRASKPPKYRFRNSRVRDIYELYATIQYNASVSTFQLDDEGNRVLGSLRLPASIATVSYGPVRKTSRPPVKELFRVVTDWTCFLQLRR